MSEDIAKIMAKIFDNSSEGSQSEDSYDVFSGESDGQSFEQKAKDVNLILEKDIEVDELDEIDEVDEVHETVKKTSEAVPETTAPTAVPEVVPETAPEVVQKTVQSEPKKELPIEDDQDILKEAESDTSFGVGSAENPLGLIGKELDAFNMLKEKYADKFDLYDGNIFMKPFYRTKSEQLFYVLSNYPLLDISSINEEIRSIKLNYSIKGIPHGDKIAEKLDELIRQRERISEILVPLYQQISVWKSVLEMLKGKLWCVKDVKGQHKREGIVADHLDDVSYYVSGIESALDAAKYLDGVLISNGDSLSRQLACIQEKRVHDPVSLKYEDNKINRTSHVVREMENEFIGEDEISTIG